MFSYIFTECQFFIWNNQFLIENIHLRTDELFSWDWSSSQISELTLSLTTDHIRLFAHFVCNYCNCVYFCRNVFGRFKRLPVNSSIKYTENPQTCLQNVYKTLQWFHETLWDQTQKSTDHCVFLSYSCDFSSTLGCHPGYIRDTAHRPLVALNWTKTTVLHFTFFLFKCTFTLGMLQCCSQSSDDHMMTQGIYISLLHRIDEMQI